MNFQDLHEALRLEMLQRIECGALTGTELARQAGFKQGHISNFLNGKRALSLDGLDRVLAAQELSVDRLMAGSLDLHAASAESVDSVPLVAPSVAMEEALVRAASIIENVPIAPARLADNRGRPSPGRAHWQRFVAVRADDQQAAAMDPLLQPGCIAILDRHYTSTAPYRPHQRTLYAVRTAAGLALRYIEHGAGVLLLRPLALNFPVLPVPLAARETAADYLVGRVCLVLNEL